MTAPEFSRPVRVDTLGAAPRPLGVDADEAERIALARRFGLVVIDRLAADLLMGRDGVEVAVEGMLSAKVTQACIATGAPLAAEIEAPFRLRFRPHPESGADEEIELSESELDVTFYDSATIDVGEAVAETLALNLDPYPRAPGAEEALEAAGVKREDEAGPFGALAGLRDKLKP
jgi:uncharacterized metal-binding protein YceD (DUF177 family)